MKTLILLLTFLFLFTACKKIDLADTLPAVTPEVANKTVVSEIDTIPNRAMLKIKLCKDSVSADETAFVFNNSASVNFFNAEDAPYFQGYGQVSLASITADGYDLAINTLPYTPGMAVRLDVHTRATGPYMLKISYEIKIPQNLQVWLKDSYLKDSVNICSRNYNFNVAETDTNSFGKKRFSVIFKSIP